MTIKETTPYTALRKLYHALRNWDKTLDDWKLYRGIRPLKDTHKGQACVVIGNGPSLKVEDLTKLHDLGIPT